MGPDGPYAPTGPEGPIAPSTPGAPTGPPSPSGPKAPLKPRGPIGPTIKFDMSPFILNNHEMKIHLSHREKVEYRNFLFVI